MTETRRSFCRFCEAACGILVDVEIDEAGTERVTRARSDPANPLSSGYTCSKGRNLPLWHHHPERLDYPEMRDESGSRRRSGWDGVLDDIAARIRSIIEEDGPDAVGVLLATGSAFDSLGRRTAERLWQALGSRSKYTSGTVDTPCKPIVSRLMTGFPGLVPTLDPRDSGMTLLIGVNPVVSHGHLNGMPDPVSLLRRLAGEGRELWVIDPRQTETAALATGHLSPRPGSDHLVLAHIVREILRDGADEEYLAEYCSPGEIEVIRELVEPWDAEACGEASGLRAEELSTLVEAVRKFGRLSCQTGTGTTMSREANLVEWMVWVLQIVTGSLDRRGGSWFNPGFLRQLDQRDLGRGGSEPSPGPRSRPELKDWMNEFPCAALVDEIEQRNLRALIVFGGNPIRALPEPERLTKALLSLDLLAVADVVETDTTRLATHVLPMAGQLERADIPLSIDQFVVTLSTQFTHSVVTPSADRRSAAWFFSALADRLGVDLGHKIPSAEVGVREEDLLMEILHRSKGDAEEIRESGYAILDPVYGWVLERVLPDGKFSLAPDVLVAQWGVSAERPTHGLVLIPRRQARHLNSQLAEPCGQKSTDVSVLHIHPNDASAREVSDGCLVKVQSAHGSVTAVAMITSSIRQGSVSIPHGFGDPNVCSLTSSTADVDPISGMVWQGGFPVEVTPTSEASAANLVPS